MNRGADNVRVDGGRDHGGGRKGESMLDKQMLGTCDNLITDRSKKTVETINEY